MSGLQQDLPGEFLFVRATGPGGILVGECWHTRSLLLAPETLREHWTPQSLGELRAEHLLELLDLAPELVLLGTGARHQILRPELFAELYRRGIGIEVMSTEAACRTYNVLASEGRKVVAALLPLAP